MDHEDVRAKVVIEARTWIGTPFHHRAAVKGAGVDCAYLLHEVFVATGVCPNVEMREYPPDWFQHRNEEWFIEDVIRHGLHEILGPPQMADIALFKIGRVYAHGVIVVEWPTVIEAWPMRNKVAEVNVVNDPYFNDRPRRFFSAWGNDGIRRR
jgi:cell wall-associated NlpC family hydrolase